MRAVGVTPNSGGSSWYLFPLMDASITRCRSHAGRYVLGEGGESGFDIVRWARRLGLFRVLRHA
jgi:hypothetical protein